MSDTHVIKRNAEKSWVTDIKLTRMKTFNSEISETSCVVLKIGERDDLDFWHNKAKKFPVAFSSVLDNIRKVMEAPTHVKIEDKFILAISLQPYIANILRRES